MELTQAHFDKQFAELNNRLDQMTTKAELEAVRAEMLTKINLKSALESQTQRLENYTDAVAQTILEAIDSGFNGIKENQISRDHRLETVEKDMRHLKGAMNLS